MTIETTYDREGEIASQTIKPQTTTIAFTAKVPRNGGFGNGEEFSFFRQVDVVPSDSDEVVEQKAKAEARFLKAFVYTQLGVEFEIVDGVVIGKELEEQPKAQASKPRSNSAAPQRSNAGGQASSSDGKKPPTQAEVDAVWAEWLQDESKFYDNRDKKASGQYKAGASDFARKSDRFGLWIESTKYTTPPEVLLRLNFDADDEF